MKRSHKLSLCCARGRAGFTLVELLVVITIIGMLMALLLPAVGAARQNARLIDCTNAMKQIATGLVSYQTAKQKFPGYLQSVKRSDGNFLVVDTSGGSSDLPAAANSQMASSTDKAKSLVSWAAVILPQLDGQSIYDLMLDGTVLGTNAPQTNRETNQALVKPFDLYVCASDSELKSTPDDAGLTYSVNCGAWDWEVADPTDQTDNPAQLATPGDVKQNGVFFDLVRRPAITHTMDTVRDGASTTILMSENVHKERETGAARWCWMGIDNLDANDLEPGEQQFGVVWTPSVNPVQEANARLKQQAFSKLGGSAPPYPKNVPEYARPASEHTGGSFNAAFVDGHVETLAQDLDYTVYQRLLTAEGRECEDPAQAYVAGSPGMPIAIDTFRKLAPVSESDY